MDLNDPEIKRLHRQRGMIKSKLTKLEKKLTEFKAGSCGDFNSMDFEGRLANHSPLLSELEKIHNDLISLNDTEEFLINCENEFTSIEDRYYAISAQMKEIIKQHSIEKDNVNLNQTNFESVIDHAEQSEQLGYQIQEVERPDSGTNYSSQNAQPQVNSVNIPNPTTFNNQLTIPQISSPPSSSLKIM